MSDSIVAKNIRKIIDQRGLKQKAVAESAGISEKKFSDMLNGRANIKAEDIFFIQDSLHVTANDLFKRSD